MARPTQPYGRRSVKSYDRDREYLIRLRSAIWLDDELDAEKVEGAIRMIDDLLRALRDLSGPARRAAIHVAK